MIDSSDASRLMNDEELQEVFSLLRQDALEDLASAYPHDIQEIHRLQQRVAVIDDFRSNLDVLVSNAQGREDDNADPV